MAFIKSHIRHSTVVITVLCAGLLAGLISFQRKFYGAMASPAMVEELFSGKDRVPLYPSVLLGEAAMGQPGKTARLSC